MLYLRVLIRAGKESEAGFITTEYVEHLKEQAGSLGSGKKFFEGAMHIRVHAAPFKMPPEEKEKLADQLKIKKSKRNEFNLYESLFEFKLSKRVREGRE
ncbi:MAG: hypothetical protein IH820_06190 [Bacteroidetes bacterium]|nr:hypothetical protein [Bacteroidota bacterium]